MGIVFRQSVKTAAVIFFGAILGAAINYLYPFNLSKDELGFLTNFMAQGAVLQFIVLMGTGPLIQVWTGKFGEGDDRKGVLFAICLLTPVIFTALISIPYFLFKSEIVGKYQIQDQPTVIRYYSWMIPFVLFWALNSILDQYLISQIRVAVAATIREVGIRVGNLLLILLMYRGLISFSGFLAASIAIYALTFVILYAYSYKKTDFRLSFNWRAFSHSEYFRMLHFSWYHLLLGISLTITGYIDVLLLAPLDKDGMSSLAIYRNAVFIATLMVLPYRAMSSASVATLNDAYLKGDTERLRSLFKRSGVNIFLVTMLMAVLISVNIYELVKLFPAGYELIAPITLILLLGRLVDMFTGLNNEIIGISQYYKYNFRLSAILLVATIVFDRLLIPRFGIFGAAWGSSIILIIYNLCKIVFLYRKMDLHPFDRGNLYIFIAGCAAALAGWLMPVPWHPLINIGLASVVIVAVYSGMILLLKPSPDLITYISELKGRRRKSG